jgi:hypothetical protein
MMLGIGLLMMLLVVGLPILMVVAVVVGAMALLNRPAAPVFPPPMQAAQKSVPAVMPARYCSHCGGDLQAGWTHCPKCGAPIEAK